MDVAGIQEELSVMGGVDQGLCRLKIAPFGEHRVGFLAVDLNRHALGPSVTEFGDRETGIDNSAPRAPTRVCASFWAGMTPSEKPA